MYKVYFELGGYMFHKTFEDFDEAKQFAKETSEVLRKAVIKERVEEADRRHKVVSKWINGKVAKGEE